MGRSLYPPRVFLWTSWLLFLRVYPWLFTSWVKLTGSEYVKFSFYLGMYYPTPGFHRLVNIFNRTFLLVKYIQTFCLAMVWITLDPFLGSLQPSLQPRPPHHHHLTLDHRLTLSPASHVCELLLTTFFPHHHRLENHGFY